MIDCLKLKKTDVVLEIGTGTGYQTAIISHLCQKIYTIEIFNKLFNQAKFNIKKLEITNVIYKLGNGVNGWEEKNFFDAIIVSAATEEISSQLLKNLKINGKLIYPKKYPSENQKLILIEKIDENNFKKRELFDVCGWVLLWYKHFLGILFNSLLPLNLSKSIPFKINISAPKTYLDRPDTAICISCLSLGFALFTILP
jgi:protein-L-isoaspartate(D-aspartate) O-methyltransferase